MYKLRLLGHCHNVPKAYVLSSSKHDLKFAVTLNTLNELWRDYAPKIEISGLPQERTAENLTDGQLEYLINVAHGEKNPYMNRHYSTEVEDTTKRRAATVLKMLEEAENSIDAKYCNILKEALSVGNQFRPSYGQPYPYASDCWYVSSPWAGNEGGVHNITAGGSSWTEGLPRSLYNYLITNYNWTKEDFEKLDAETKAIKASHPEGSN